MIDQLECLLKRIPFFYQRALRAQAGVVGFKRYLIARKYLRGHGVEIGALHNPLRVGEGVQVDYVDRLTQERLQVEYPEMKDFHHRFVRVDIVDDGEVLGSLSDGSLDFVIANHMLEHCENPLGTMRNHLNKLARGGILYYAIPDKSRTFDRDRPLTTFDHLVQDDVNGPNDSRESHYQEFVECAAPYTWLGEKVKDRHSAMAVAKELMDSGYSIHFHVWNAASLFAFLHSANGYLDDRFVVEQVGRNGSETIAVLKKR